MSIKLSVPSIACQGCADTITKAIKNHESEATVEVDVPGKTVTIDAKTSEESIKEIITSTGHTIA